MGQGTSGPGSPSPYSAGLGTSSIGSGSMQPTSMPAQPSGMPAYAPQNYLPLMGSPQSAPMGMNGLGMGVMGLNPNVGQSAAGGPSWYSQHPGVMPMAPGGASTPAPAPVPAHAQTTPSLIEGYQGRTPIADAVAGGQYIPQSATAANWQGGQSYIGEGDKNSERGWGNWGHLNAGNGPGQGGGGNGGMGQHGNVPPTGVMPTNPAASIPTSSMVGTAPGGWQPGLPMMPGMDRGHVTAANPIMAHAGYAHYAHGGRVGFAPGGATHAAMQAAKQIPAPPPGANIANGVSGALASPVAGRTDHLPISVPQGSFVIPADVVSAVGEGNTNNGFKVIERTFGAPQQQLPKGAHGGVDIMAAGGEFIIPPQVVAQLGGGDIRKGLKALGQWVVQERQKNISTLKAMPGPHS